MGGHGGPGKQHNTFKGVAGSLLNTHSNGVTPVLSWTVGPEGQLATLLPNRLHVGDRVSKT